MKTMLESGKYKEAEKLLNDKEVKGKMVVIDGRCVVERWGEVLIREIEGTKDEISMNFTAPGELYEDHPSLKYEIPFWIYFNLNKESAEIVYHEESDEIEIKTVPK